MSCKVQNDRSVIDHLENDPKPFITFEIIPPKRGENIEDLEKIVSELAPYNPPYIDVTSHPSQINYKESQEGIVKMVFRKRPGTESICSEIQRTYKIDAVPHVLCFGFTREETEDFLINISYSRIKNVLAIKGDDDGYKKELGRDKTVNNFASDLVKQISDMNKGKYLRDLEAKPTNFCIGVAGYPEKHFQAPNLEWDIKNLKRKLDEGASYVVTQMFFDNLFYYKYVDKCKKEGIDVPIIPGLKIINSKKNLTSIPENFHVAIPPELTDKIENVKNEDIENIGVEWTYKQIKGLFENEVPSIHLYVMQNTKAVKKLMEKLKVYLKN